MELERLDRRDLARIAVCAVVAAVSLYVGVKYFFKAFPEASIEFKTTKQSSLPVAESFLTRLGEGPGGYRHASVFGFDDEAKTFLEREVGVEESQRLLDTTIHLWRWEHRWFRPLQKEELRVDVTTRGEVVGFHHLLPEEAQGAFLSADEARPLAERFLTDTMKRPLESLTYVETALLKRPHRADHTFTWKLKGSEVKGADYRIEIGIAGDRVASYDERLKLPDAWVRDYEKLRSKNQIAGLVDTALLLLTVVAMLVLLVRRIRGGDIRWHTAGILGGITCFLATLSQLNSLPSDLFAYDTTTSFPGFLVERVFYSVVAGLSFGAVIFVIAAAAEPLYRQRFPGFLSLTSLVRFRSLRTKEWFTSLLIGITLTFFFFAYENVFYIIANSFGAWAPREVAYSDLLSTAFPWVFVLFFGWFPAISEEFISRMFSIPFFEWAFAALRLPLGVLRLPVAVVVSAFIWGFGHAAYPNQPFWIRGLEVGLAGIVFSLVLLRFGIAAVVVCHFSVDALYTAFVLIRSSSPYYVVTGCLSAGVFVILFFAALAAYFVKGGFLPAEVTNEVEGIAPPPAPAPRGEAEGEERPAAAAYQRMTGRRIAAGLGLAAALAALSFVPLRSFGDWVDFKATRLRAKESGSTFLRGCGFEVSAYRSAVEPLDRTDPTAAAYVRETGGLEKVKELYRDRVPTPLWRVRFFVPGQQEEYSVSIDPATGTAVGFTRTLPDDAAGATLDKAQALTIAETFVRARGQEPRSEELKEQTEKDEKARRDHTLVWEHPVDGAGEAKVRFEVVVQGDRVGSWTRRIKIPEAWQRERETTTAVTILQAIVKYLYFGSLGGVVLILFILKIRSGTIPWAFASIAGALAAISVILSGTVNLDQVWASKYDTSWPAGLFGVLLVVSFFLSGVLFFLLGTVVVGLAGALYPGAASMFSRSNRRRLAMDALVAGLIACGFRFGLAAIPDLVGALLPAGRIIRGTVYPESVGTSVPLLFVLGGLLLRTILLAAAGGIAAGLLSCHFRHPLVRGAFGFFLVVALLPVAARKPAEIAVSALSSILVLAGVLVLVRFFLRDNPLAWVWSAWLATGVAAATSLMSQSSPFYRWSGALSLFFVLLPGLWLLKEAIAGTRLERSESPAASALS